MNEDGEQCRSDDATVATPEASCPYIRRVFDELTDADGVFFVNRHNDGPSRRSAADARNTSDYDRL